MNQLFKALDDPTRRSIISMLKERDMTAGEIAAAFNISKPSISHHLNLLKQADLVIAVKQGQFVYYSLNINALGDVMNWMMNLINPKNDTK